MEKIWLKSYPEGVPADITQEASAYPSLTAMMLESCEQYKDRVAYDSMSSTITYGELEQRSAHFGAWLQSIGVQKGERVALMMPNILQYPICLLGTLRIGAAVVNTNPLYTASELKHQLSDSGATTIVIAENFAHTLQEVIHETQIKNVVVTSLGELLGGLKGPITDFVVRRVKKLIPQWNLPGAVKLRDALKMGAQLRLAEPTLSQDDLALLQYTGGTTGVAKGTILTHGNMVHNVCQAQAWVRPYIDTTNAGSVVTALPLYHIFAFTANCLVFMRLGARNLLIVNPRDIKTFVKELDKAPFSYLTGVNTLFNALLQSDDFKKLDFSAFQIALGGGMAVQEAVAKRWLQVTGVPISQAYGLTETSPAATINPMDATEFTGSIGLPIPSTDIAIRDDAQHDMPIGESGEICIRGPQVTHGYWNRPDETKKAFDDDGFLRTGDIGYMNEAGYIYILDRKKDMILVSGFNVYPNEIEAVAIEHPDIIEAAAIGIPDEHSGEVVKLYVISRNPNLTQEEVIAHLRKRLTSYKIPKVVDFRDDLPRTNVGKVLRRKLKEL